MPEPQETHGGADFLAKKLAAAATPQPDRRALVPPSIGRIVHFVYGEHHFAAIITDPAFTVREPDRPTWEGQALTVFPPGAAPWTTVAHYDAAGTPGSWHWPEFVT